MIRGKGAAAPRVAIVLGTGLGLLADRIEAPLAIPYAEIPNFPHATVVGHAGRLVFGMLRGVPVAAMQGRFHLYEGYTPQQVALPARVLRTLGAEVLIVTNASGGLDPAQNAGDLLLLRDHIGLPTMGGLNPLRGPNDERLGPRFPSMTEAYDGALRTLARDVAHELGIALSEGVYAMVSGPNYESPAELRFLRTAGADAVGMSTVPEVIAARHMGMRVLAISCVTNAALKDAEAAEDTSHFDVVAAAERAGANLAALVEGIVAHL
jgi:purine-nucleoside phosphorylase